FVCFVSLNVCLSCVCFFFQAEDGIRDATVTGVQTCALPIFAAAGDAEIRLGAVIDDESAAGHDVAVSICGAACKREGERRDAGSKTGPNCTHDHSSVTEWPR